MDSPSVPPELSCQEPVLLVNISDYNSVNIFITQQLSEYLLFWHLIKIQKKRDFFSVYVPVVLTNPRFYSDKYFIFNM